MTTPSSPSSPPPLPYDLHSHKLSIAIIWTLLALDSVILPLVLFYPLWFSTALHSRPAIIFAITTSVFGLISGLEWAYRSWQLLSTEEVRPLGVQGYRGGTRWWRRKREGDWEGNGRWWGFDAFHWWYTGGYCVALIELIIGAAPHHPFIRLCAMPSPSFITIFGVIMLSLNALHHLRLPAPFRISSQPKGSRPVKPATYTILEDVMSVDTGVGRRYRSAVKERYESSAAFRRLLRQMDLFWGKPAFVIGVGSMIAVGHPGVDQTVAYGIGWGVPPLWAVVWAGITTVWVKVALRREREGWRLREKGEGV